MSFSRAVKAKIAGKRDPERDAEAQAWIEAVTGEKFNCAYEDFLRDGQVLCRLINKLQPNSVTKINSQGGQFKMMENISNFLKAAQTYGVAELDIFQSIDLYEKKDISIVTNMIFQLGSQTYNHPEWTGPKLGNKPASENKRDFSEETLRAGEGMIGLQAGSNKGASQSGLNMGNSRHIIHGK